VATAEILLFEDHRMAVPAREVVDRFHSVRLGISLRDLRPREVAVATCDRRTYAERGHGFVRLLWVLNFGDRVAISVHPGALRDVARLAWIRTPEQIMADEFIQQARQAVLSALSGCSLRKTADGVILFHGGRAPRVRTRATIRAIRRDDPDTWVGERIYMRAAEHPSARRGEAFGVFLGEEAVAEVITHEPPVAEMVDLMAADGIEVSQAHRGQGYGNALLAHWTRAMQARGRVCVHSTDAENAASIGMARSLGYVEYAWTRSVTCSPREAD